jgi:hypothetical protein
VRNLSFSSTFHCLSLNLGTDCGIDCRYHFTCVVISEPEAEEISKLVFFFLLRRSLPC